MTDNTQKLLDSGAVAQGVILLNQAGALVSPVTSETVPILQQDLIGGARSYYPGKTRRALFAHRSGINNTYHDLWDGPTQTYVFPTTPMQMRIVSTSASDSAAGVGVRQVHIHYLNANWLECEITVTLNGTNAVLTVPVDIIRVQLMYSVAVGTLGVAAGDISLTNVAGTVTYSLLLNGLNFARQAITSMADGSQGFITHWQSASGSSGNHFCQMVLRATTFNGELISGVFLVQDEQGTQNGGIVINFPIPIPLPPRCDVKLSAVSDAVNANVTALGAILGWCENI